MKRNKILPKLLSDIKLLDISQICGFKYETGKSTLIYYLIEKQLQMKTLITIFLGIVFFASFQPVHSQNFYLHQNGVTCMCPNAVVGDTGTVNGVVYTKRTRDQITTENASTTCTSGITDMSDMFSNTSFNGDISTWDVSNVTNMAYMFSASQFNQTINNWDVSSVTKMNGMFVQAVFNQPIGDWNVGNVTDMSWMFSNAQFNQPIDNWNVSNVTNMEGMFAFSLFNKHIGSWNVGNVTTMYYMFYYSQFNQPIDSWDVSHVTDMSWMFYASQFNQPVDNWNVSNVTNMSSMFNNSQFNQPIGNWDVGNVTDMSFMFLESPFNNALGDWDVSNVTTMERLFQFSSFNQPIENWDVSNVTNMSAMFAGAPFNQPIVLWDVSHVTDMSWMFSETPFNQPIGIWDVSNVTNMSGMFASTPFNQPIDLWDVSHATDMSWMFSETPFNQPIGSWDVSSVTKMEKMFQFSPFNQPIENWDVSQVTVMEKMFYNTPFNHPIADWDVSNANNMSSMFSVCSFNQNISAWIFHNEVTFSSDILSFVSAGSFSTENYDLLLQSFSDQNLLNKYFPANDLKYCNSDAHNDLINNKGWTITGDHLTTTEIISPNDLTIIAEKDSCFVANVELGAPIAQSCLSYTISNNAPEIFPLGSTEIIWTITDANGVSDWDTQIVLVTTPDGATSIPTSIVAPGNLTVIADQGSCVSTGVDLGIPTTQSCLGFIVGNNAPAAFPLGLTEVVWTITDESGLTLSDVQHITVTMEIDEATICYVSSDDKPTTYNEIFITNTNGNNVVHYEIMRETSSNVFQQIGILLPGETSFLDSTSDNSLQTYSYKVRTFDICDRVSAGSPTHSTILLQSNISISNTVNLSWTNYEGVNFDVYKIYRKANAGDFELIVTLSSNTSVYTDNQANVLENTYEYYVAIEVPPCATGSRFAISEIKSNTTLIGPNAISDDFLKNEVIIHPNPIFSTLNIELPENITLSSGIIYNTLGHKVMTFNATTVSVEHLAPSAYYVKISTSKGEAAKTFIKL